MITVNTSRFGHVEIEEKDVIQFPQGIIGFTELKRYVLLDHDQESPFKWLQSLEDGKIAFVVLNPLLFCPDYRVEILASEVQDLGLEKETDAVVCVIMTMPADPQGMTANLKAPLIFNLQNRKGKQIILSGSPYHTRHNVLEELRKSEELQKNLQEKNLLKEELQKASDLESKKTQKG